jgi:pimeloyl-ACP methyl ester carboxylesterase/DNA-binding CsgD family transcriptional regulator
LQQKIGFLTDRRGQSVAYSTVGRGRPLIVCETGFVTHLEVLWSYPPLRRFLEALAPSHQVVRFDFPGTGLGDPAGEIASFEQRAECFEDVVAGLGLESFDALVTSQAGPAAIAFAARHPGRIGRLILFGTFADGRAISERPITDALYDLIRASWGLASGTLADLMLPHADEHARRFWARLMRSSTSSEKAAGLFAEAFVTDVRDLLPRVDAETLVLHRRDDACIPFELGRRLAAGIPGARLLPLAGSSHLFYVGDVDAVLSATLDFLGDRRTAPRGQSALSRREREVAGLIALGLSNAEIGLRLGISLRTAESHAEHIRDKLGFRSRSQISAWAVENLAPEPGTAKPALSVVSAR